MISGKQYLVEISRDKKRMIILVWPIVRSRTFVHEFLPLNIASRLITEQNGNYGAFIKRFEVHKTNLLIGGYHPVLPGTYQLYKPVNF